MIVYGINPVLEALGAGRVTALRVSESAGDRAAGLAAAAAREGIAVRRVSRADLDRAARGGRHQGVVAELRDPDRADLASLLKAARGAPLLVVLDGIEDPHNLGAILRTVDAAGADGVVRQVRHAAPLGGVVAKASGDISRQSSTHSCVGSDARFYAASCSARSLTPASPSRVSATSVAFSSSSVFSSSGTASFRPSSPAQVTSVP